MKAKKNSEIDISQTLEEIAAISSQFPVYQFENHRSQDDEKEVTTIMSYSVRKFLESSAGKEILRKTLEEIVKTNKQLLHSSTKQAVKEVIKEVMLEIANRESIINGG